MFVATLHCEAQINLVPNGSFEEADTCAVQLGYFPNGKPLHWYSVSDTPDYYRSCVPYGSPNGVPVNTVGFQSPHDGESYSGMFAHLVADYREMIGTELLEPLTIGQTYYGSFWANAGYGGPQQTGSACNNTGMLFTISSEPWEQGMPQFTLRNYAQIHSQQVISDTAGWTLVSGSFVADSAYRYMVIGNQFDNASTTVQIIGPGEPSKAYVYVDAVCLSTDPAGCPMWTSVAENIGDEIGLWPNPASEWLRVSWGRSPVRRALVMDPLGHRVIEQQVMGSKEVTLDMHSWPEGIYQLVLEEEGVKQVKKFVVMH